MFHKKFDFVPLLAYKWGRQNLIASMAVSHMAQDARISSRINAELKQQGDSILAEIGIKPSQAITMFYKQIVRQRGLPFETRIPNDETIKALNEDLSEKKRFSSVEEFMDDLNS